VAGGGRFRLNDGTATGKVIDDEAILINVVTGRYYSLVDAGCVAWIQLSAGGSIPEAVTAVLERYDTDSQTVEAEVPVLVQELLDQGLLVEASADRSISLPDELPPTDGARREYTGLALLTFTDMEDLLAFDPPLPPPSLPGSPNDPPSA
jgi:Coenzyme PQQ synthesis protein D (PqqD)